MLLRKHDFSIDILDSFLTHGNILRLWQERLFSLEEIAFTLLLILFTHKRLSELCA
jgi:hypothetical protein